MRLDWNWSKLERGASCQPIELKCRGASNGSQTLVHPGASQDWKQQPGGSNFVLSQRSVSRKRARSPSAAEMLGGLKFNAPKW